MYLCMRRTFLPLFLLSIVLIGCSSSKKDAATIYSAGDKATVGPLTYSVTDAERDTELGDPTNPRTPKDRFYLIRVSVSNSSADETTIPAMTLVDEAGQTYSELSDGSGVQDWLGVVRKVGATQTENGYAIFDAPSKHYRLRLNDPLDEKEISIDLPLTFVRDSTRTTSPASAIPSAASPADAPLQVPK